MSKKLTTEQFIEKAKVIHGDKYDYSKVEYVNNKAKVLIKCNICGCEFWQTPNNHLTGYGCPKCKANTIGNQHRMTLPTFLQRAKAIYGDKYDYSKVEYVNTDTKVIIICPEHGEFYQRPHDHLNGHGCPACSGRDSLTKEKFISRAKDVHGNKYDYSKVEYINDSIKVCIICNKCGTEFWQQPGNHVRQKQGCPACNESHGEREIKLFLEEHNINFEVQKEFENCRNIRPLPFDFYLPDYNLCIEFQGEQHFKPIKHFGGDKKFEYRQTNDSIKRDWCSKEENPNLLEIDYTEFDSIEEILTKNLKDFVIII